MTGECEGCQAVVEVRSVAGRQFCHACTPGQQDAGALWRAVKKAREESAAIAVASFVKYAQGRGGGMATLGDCAEAFRESRRRGGT